MRRVALRSSSLMPSMASRASSNAPAAYMRLPAARLYTDDASNNSAAGGQGGLDDTRLFVGGLSWGTDNASLRQAFQNHGDIKDGE
jgi:hypothetical protein